MAVAATLSGVVYVALLRIPSLSASSLDAVSDFGQILAASCAAAGCAVAARRTLGHRRQAWMWLSIGTGAWGAGQVVWTYYEVLLGQEVPFPSLADVGYLVFPLAAGWGLVRWLGTQGDQLVARGRDVMDGVVIAGSLLTLSWTTALGSVVAGGDGDGWFSLVLSLAYPVGDLIITTLVLIALGRGRAEERTPLLLLALGLVVFSLADSAFVYLTSTSTFSSSDLISNGGWFTGFLLVGVAGVAVPTAQRDATSRPSPEQRRLAAAKPSGLRLGLPYVPLLAALTMVGSELMHTSGAPIVALTMVVALVAMVLLRQFLAVLDNERLLAALADAHDQLEHQAMHDSLTGLPNRVLFADRLDQALMHPQASVSVMFCDLDDFKHVNDDLGHEAGDQLLQEIARRLVSCVRGTDTVARLGGDEFAILLDDSSDAAAVAERVVDSMAGGAEVSGHHVPTSISVGLAHHRGAPGLAAIEAVGSEGQAARRRTTSADGAHRPSAVERERLAAELLRQADTAMYSAKGAGKSRAVVAEVLDAPERPADVPVADSDRLAPASR